MPGKWARSPTCLDPIQRVQLAQLGREPRVAAQTRRIEQLNPRDYLEATLRNEGRAQFDARTLTPLSMVSYDRRGAILLLVVQSTTW